MYVSYLSAKYCQLQKKAVHIFYLAEYFIIMLSLRWKLNLLTIYFECFLHQSPTCWPDTVSASILSEAGVVTHVTTEVLQFFKCH